MGGLADLPDDVLHIVLAHLESARDVRALTLACRRLHSFVVHEGWRIFVRSRFPSLSVPVPVPAAAARDHWASTAESLTWQSRAWDRRALRFTALLPHAARPSRSHRPSTAAFQAIVDARLYPETGEELVVWGAGENLVGVYRPQQRRRPHQGRGHGGAAGGTTWHTCEGQRYGYVPGYDDVKALAIVADRARDGRPGILTGRDNGDLCLVSADPRSFGDRLAHFSPAHTDNRQSTIMSLDVSDDLVAATSKESVLLYRLPTEAASRHVPPLEVYELDGGGGGGDGGGASRPRASVLGHAKWMGSSALLALALRSNREPLRYLALTPTGWVSQVAAKNADLEQRFGLGAAHICPHSLQAVRPHANAKGETSLLLSAWRDGTCRLQDLRTPSPFDVVYQDNIHPWSEMESLLAYGTERFVGGDMHSATVKLFDFRWTKGYYHTAALPCAPLRPFPPPPQPFVPRPPDEGPTPACCDHPRGLRCRWHALARHIYYRPNATFFLSQSLPPEYRYSRVWSLAKASDVSPNFYVGLAGGVVEADLQPSVIEPSPTSTTTTTTTRTTTRTTAGTEEGEHGYEEGDPHLGLCDWISGGGSRGAYSPSRLRVTMMETGDGLASPINLRTIRLPPIYSRWGAGPPPQLTDIDRTLRQQHRLDSRFQKADDFRDMDAGEA